MVVSDWPTGRPVAPFLAAVISDLGVVLHNWLRDVFVLHRRKGYIYNYIYTYIYIHDYTVHVYIIYNII